MNKIINKSLLNGDIFMLELHFKQPEFVYRAYETFTKHCEKIQRFKETGSLKYLYKNYSGKFSFAYDAAYSDSKDLA